METHDPTSPFATDRELARLSRRALIGGALGTAAVGATALPSAAHGTIVSYSSVGGARTRYEVGRNYSSFGYRPAFHDRFGQWLYWWEANASTMYKRPFEVTSFGVHTDHRVTEAHNNGVGFDLTRISVNLNGAGTQAERFNARYDIWKNYAEPERSYYQTRYWATAAALHRFFAFVITWPYNTAHHNHIHVDVLQSGYSDSYFSTARKTQVQHVQASCTYVWGLPLAIDGIWGPKTSAASTRVLRAAGVSSGTLLSGQSYWKAFNTATMRKGYSRQSYPAP